MKNNAKTKGKVHQFLSEAGRKGGLKTSFLHGREHFVKIAKEKKKELSPVKTKQAACI